METILRVAAIVFYTLVGLLLVGAILIQEGKGGGLAALGGTRAETAFGASNPIRRLTVALAIIFFVLAGVLSWWLPRGGEMSEGRRVTAPGEPTGALDPDARDVVPADEKESPAAPAEEVESPAAPAEDVGRSTEEPSPAEGEPRPPAEQP